MDKAAIMDNPAPDNDASVKSLGIFLHKNRTSEWIYSMKYHQDSR